MLNRKEYDILTEIQLRYFKGLPLFDCQTERKLINLGYCEYIDEGLFITEAGKKALTEYINR